jgi:hypothetical protein
MQRGPYEQLPEEKCWQGLPEVPCDMQTMLAGWPLGPIGA